MWRVCPRQAAPAPWRSPLRAAARWVPLPVPPPAEQTEIVRRVESLFAYADRLEARYSAARAQVEKLTPAALVKAFRGELVPKTPTTNRPAYWWNASASGAATMRLLAPSVAAKA